MTTHFTATVDKIGHYVEQARDTTADLIVVLLQTSGLQTDGALADHADLAAVLAATNDEATFTNYVRKTLATPTRTVDGALDHVLLGGAAVGTALTLTYTAAGGTTNNSLGKVLFCYLPAAGAADSLILPLMATDVAATTNGNDLAITLDANGFARARRP